MRFPPKAVRLMRRDRGPVFNRFTHDNSIFGFFKKRSAPAADPSDPRKIFEKVIADVKEGRGNMLEAALVMNIVQPSREAYTHLVMASCNAEVITFNDGPDRLRNAMTTVGSDGAPYVACFSSIEQVGSQEAFPPYTQERRVSFQELAFALGPEAGIVLNFQSPLHWSLPPAQVEQLRNLMQVGCSLSPGQLFSIWSRDAYRVAKVLVKDERGVHVRIYANQWASKPANVKMEELTLQSPTEDNSRPAAYGHLPVATRSFLAMGPIAAGEAVVSEDELKGYNLWKEAGAGYFGE